MGWITPISWLDWITTSIISLVVALVVVVTVTVTGGGYWIYIFRWIWNGKANGWCKTGTLLLILRPQLDHAWIQRVPRTHPSHCSSRRYWKTIRSETHLLRAPDTISMAKFRVRSPGTPSHTRMCTRISNKDLLCVGFWLFRFNWRSHADGIHFPMMGSDGCVRALCVSVFRPTPTQFFGIKYQWENRLNIV